MTRFDLVIFDCDGVLVDSEPHVNRIFANTLTEAGFKITYEEVVQQFVGKSMATCLEIIEQSFGNVEILRTEMEIRNMRNPSHRDLKTFTRCEAQVRPHCR